MKLTDFRTLGRSGLVVSPLALGTMTFGNAAWGSPDDVSRAIFDAYLDAGGNFVDTADVYAGGRSEELVGGFIAERRLRDQVVLASKFAFNAQKGNPNAGGNGRKNIYRALEGSLKRLQTDYLDVYWLHVWDMVTPAEEVLGTLGDLMRAGMIRYFGYSDMPAWYAAKAAALAGSQHAPGPIAMQLEYSLVARQLEGEHAPAAHDAGMGLVPWSPLAAGFLSGKYTREGVAGPGASGQGRLSGPNPFGSSKFTDANWQTLDALRAVAAQLDRPPAQVALAWVAAQPGVASVILGASKLEQLHSNLAALEITLTPEQRQTLNAASASSTRLFQPGPAAHRLRRAGGSGVGRMKHKIYFHVAALLVSCASAQVSAEVLTLTGKVGQVKQSLEIRDGLSKIGVIKSDGTFSLALDSSNSFMRPRDDLRGVDDSGFDCKNDTYSQNKSRVHFIAYRTFSARAAGVGSSYTLLAGGYEGDTWYGGKGTFVAFVYASEDVQVRQLWSCKDSTVNTYNSGFVDLALKKGWNVVLKSDIYKKYKDYEIYEAKYSVAPANQVVKWQLLDY